MGYRSGWLAVSNTVPRLDLLKYPEGGPRAAANALKMLLPGWRLTGRTVGMMLGRGPERRIFLGTWGSTIVLGGDGSVLNDLERRLSSKKHRPDGLGVWSMWASTVVSSVEFFVRAPGWDRYVCTECNDYFDEDDSGGDMSLDYSGTPLPFESRLWDEGRYPPGDYDYDALPFSEEDFALCADQWVLGLISPEEIVGWGVKGLIEERAPDSDDLVMHEAAPGLIRRLTLSTR